MKQIAILGSTGSIGCNTLRVVEAFKDEFSVAALGAGANTELLAEQIEQFRPRVVSVGDESHAESLRLELRKRNVPVPKIATGVEGLCEVATVDSAEIVIGAVVGALGLLPTYRALELGRRVALANKETLVVAGELMTRAAEKSGAELLPVDSEHNALHQCLRGERRHELKRLILTASGGPFRNASREEIEQATPAQALKHPTWRMGAKITIDSATLMNKGLEVIEARWLFNCCADEIDIVVHPQSVVHSMIEMVDGSIIAQLGVTDMRHAIQYALTYPDRRPSQLPALDLAALSKLEFFPPDTNKFPCVKLAYRALRTGGTLPAVLNAANEVAVAAFLDEKIRFGDISRLIEAACNAHTTQPAENLETVLAADRWARSWINAHISEARAQMA
ncbi:MAG TPA: 1-deoxy-D-xylulose-5-phosphate reductoisomerase [Blastocatellia bacterium]|nr:1-deoxy-D-xylulose-5-phosphate reductoisomerase [Blastocatellia bacterium]HMV83795.1 1-deoxy-D-xylulose-5-phosphate reductoisomerase [Blastocatellia bacterium]HMX29295.1 1-deoxy-D-xylulose-5-phosphate reductoisomerase [Blastocatellia bacterium]HMY74195.1 1-deoxy-D-xylulose-5-phosphate reductoisomerase [Blastocatellia bacterium]HMZ19510.1 1-deoxy-D-xylulose-5-phosphate reductoisomerase [Blastocatellia bacterium]